MHELPLQPADFRSVAGHYATGIAVVTSHVDGVPHAMTANSFTTVSLDPLLVSVCVQHGTRFHEAVLAAGVWAASFLAADSAHLARRFATRGRALAEQFDGVPTTVAGNGCLVLSGALAAIAAATTQVITAGDHDILVGRASGLYRRGAGGGPGPGTPRLDQAPIVYFRSSYGSWLRLPEDGPNIDG